MTVKHYVLVGAGARGLNMFARPLLNVNDSAARLVALVDINPLRLIAANRLLGTNLPTFTDFEQMLRDINPDGVIIATRDDTHADLVVRALGAGKRVYCEKPLCISVEQCQQIMSAARSSTAEGFVTHNARYNQDRQLIKHLIDAGRLGQIQHVEFRQHLDFDHGADYFRRWHKHKRFSGGLVIHKGTHHFDFLNWIIGSRPQRLRAEGGTFFYGKSGPFRSLRCRGCEHASQCRFHLDLGKDERLRTLYADAESSDGYLRDACLFDPTIDTEDYVTTQLTYENGVRVNYQLCAYSSYEGNSVVIQGTQGRLEYHVMHLHHALGKPDPAGLTHTRQMVIYDFWAGTAQRVELPELKSGGHGGADPLLRHDFFERPWDSPRPDRMATLNEAIQAVLIGAAVNQSMSNDGAPVEIQSLLDRAAGKTPMATSVAR